MSFCEHFLELILFKVNIICISSMKKNLKSIFLRRFKATQPNCSETFIIKPGGEEQGFFFFIFLNLIGFVEYIRSRNLFTTAKYFSI